MCKKSPQPNRKSPQQVDFPMAQAHGPKSWTNRNHLLKRLCLWGVLQTYWKIVLPLCLMAKANEFLKSLCCPFWQNPTGSINLSGKYEKLWDPAGTGCSWRHGKKNEGRTRVKRGSNEGPTTQQQERGKKEKKRKENKGKEKKEKKRKERNRKEKRKKIKEKKRRKRKEKNRKENQRKETNRLEKKRKENKRRKRKENQRKKKNRKEKNGKEKKRKQKKRTENQRKGKKEQQERKGERNKHTKNIISYWLLVWCFLCTVQ